jgi:hypothetical protein
MPTTTQLRSGCYRRNDGGVVKVMKDNRGGEDYRGRFVACCGVPGCAKLAHGKGGVGARCSRKAHRLK